MNWMNLTDATAAAQELIKKIPNEYDAIVGIPRSGMWLASMIACKFGRPLAVPDGGWWVSSGMTRRFINNALLVDDTVSLGGAMAKAKMHLDFPAKTAALIVQPGSEHLVDYYQVVMEHPRLYEWNLAHAKKGRVAYDIDGVLCPNPPAYTPEFLASDEYADFIRFAPPRLLPAYGIDLVVTGRTERHREATEEWLARHGVHYGALSMVPEVHERTAAYHAGWKARACVDHAIDYMVESDIHQAVLIGEYLEIPVVCTDNMRLYGGRK
jgi:uncharacterized HAD superfamily protein